MPAASGGTSGHLPHRTVRVTMATGAPAAGEAGGWGARGVPPLPPRTAGAGRGGHEEPKGAASWGQRAGGWKGTGPVTPCHARRAQPVGAGSRFLRARALANAGEARADRPRVCRGTSGHPRHLRGPAACSPRCASRGFPPAPCQPGREGNRLCELQPGFGGVLAPDPRPAAQAPGKRCHSGESSDTGRGRPSAALPKLPRVAACLEGTGRPSAASSRQVTARPPLYSFVRAT